MFCIRCGKPNDDDTMFCEFCGAQISDPEENGQPATTSEAQTPAASAVPAPVTVTAPAPAPAPAPKKRKKGGVIAAIITSAAVLIAAAVVVFIFLNKRSAPALNGEPTMTLNGKNVQVGLAMMGINDSYVYVGIASKTDDEIFQVEVGFPKEHEPKSNITINSSDDEYDIETAFGYVGKDSPIFVSYNGTYYYDLDHFDVDKFSVEIGEYAPNEYIDILISGKTEIKGKTYDFKAGGRLKFDANYEETGEEWHDNNRIPAPSDNNAPTTPSQPAAVTEIEIKGEKYSADLTFIDLSGKGLKNGDIADLKYMTKLKRVELSGNDLSDISVLRDIPTLEEINADDNHIKDISFLDDLKNLKIVVMNNNSIEDISVFSKFSTIQKIWLCENNIKDISSIAGNKGLTELGLNNCNIKDISALKGMNKLELLCLYNCGLTDVSVLSGCTSIKELHIGENDIKDYAPIYDLGFDYESSW